MMDAKRALLQHPYYKELSHRLEMLESDRIYCKHGDAHVEEVYEIMTALGEKNHLSFSDDVYFATAYLHDLGRVAEYEKGIPHEQAGEKIAREILSALSLEEADISLICDAISSHRKRQTVQRCLQQKEHMCTLRDLLSYADQMSRTCFSCDAKDTCHWREEEQLKSEDWDQRIL